MSIQNTEGIGYYAFAFDNELLVLSLRLEKPSAMRVHGPNKAGKVVQTDPTLLRYVSVITELKRNVRSVGSKV